MKKVGGSTEYVRTAEGYVQKPFALYGCEEHHLTEVFSGYNNIVFSKWEEAPEELNIGCPVCNLESRGGEDT